MSADYQKTVSEHLRITVLRLLADQVDYSLNESLLLDLVGNFGFAPSRDRLRTELAWLAEQGLVTLGGVDHCRVAILTPRGEDVARCRAVAPGVKRPRPGELG
ncbi:MAG: ArsR family transcriptional regulator [Deltaproteobacteria bacterium]|nr:ArsR family transcriptional regulator [Deltaproteobacteria bacterium]